MLYEASASMFAQGPFTVVAAVGPVAETHTTVAALLSLFMLLNRSSELTGFDLSAHAGVAGRAASRTAVPLPLGIHAWGRAAASVC